MKPFELGMAVIEPDHPIEAGALVTINYTYIAGHPIDDTGSFSVMLAISALLNFPTRKRQITAQSQQLATAASSRAGIPKGTYAPGAVPFS